MHTVHAVSCQIEGVTLGTVVGHACFTDASIFEIKDHQCEPKISRWILRENHPLRTKATAASPSFVLLRRLQHVYQCQVAMAESNSMYFSPGGQPRFLQFSAEVRLRHASDASAMQERKRLFAKDAYHSQPCWHNCSRRFDYSKDDYVETVFSKVCVPLIWSVAAK